MFSFLQSIPSIASEDLQARIDQNQQYMLIDVRSPEEYAQGHIQGSRLIPLDVLSNSIKNIVPDTTQEIIVNCRSGGRSAQAVHVLKSLGYTKVINLTGGVIAWENAGFKLVR